MKKILVLNSGSSSLKYQLFNVEGENYEVVAKGVADRIGIHGSNIVLKCGNDKQTKNVDLPTHTEAIREVLDMLLSGPLHSMDELSAVGHRVVHGGEIFKSSALVTEQVKKDIEDLAELAPLHNPANLLGIKAVEKLLPNIPQVVVFDTAFHQTMEKEAFLRELQRRLNGSVDYIIDIHIQGLLDIRIRERCKQALSFFCIVAHDCFCIVNTSVFLDEIDKNIDFFL